MAYPKGAKRPIGAGRKKGTPNKASVSIRELMEKETGGIPAPITLWRAGQKAFNTGMQGYDSGLVSAGLGAMGKAMGYAYQQLKAVEHTGEIQTGPAVVVEMIVSDEPASKPSAP